MDKHYESKEENKLHKDIHLRHPFPEIRQALKDHK